MAKRGETPSKEDNLYLFMVHTIWQRTTIFILSLDQTTFNLKHLVYNTIITLCPHFYFNFSLTELYL